MQIHSLALEERMLLEVDNNVEVTRGAVAQPSFATSRAAQTGPLVNPRGNFQFYARSVFHPPVAIARPARFFDDPAGSLAVRTRLRNLKETARRHDLSAPAANRTRHGLRTFLRSRTVACLANVEFADLDFLFASARSLLQ